MCSFYVYRFCYVMSRNTASHFGLKDFLKIILFFFYRHSSVDPRPTTSRQTTPSTNLSRQASLDLSGSQNSRNGSLSSLARVPSTLPSAQPSTQPSLSDLRQVSRPVSYESLSSRLAHAADHGGTVDVLKIWTLENIL